MAAQLAAAIDSKTDKLAESITENIRLTKEAKTAAEQAKTAAEATKTVADNILTVVNEIRTTQTQEREEVIVDVC